MSYMDSAVSLADSYDRYKKSFNKKRFIAQNNQTEIVDNNNKLIMGVDSADDFEKEEKREEDRQSNETPKFTPNTQAPQETQKKPMNFHSNTSSIRYITTNLLL